MHAVQQQLDSWHCMCGRNTVVVTRELQELSEPSSPAHREHAANSRRCDDDPQLRQLADTMQQQIGALARAVEDLKEV
jgi:hypothetical protein